MTNSIAIPIRDEIGTLVGIKARRMEYDPNSGISKYFFSNHVQSQESCMVYFKI